MKLEEFRIGNWKTNTEKITITTQEKLNPYEVKKYERIKCMGR